MRKFSFPSGATAGLWLLTLMIIVAELATPFKELLKAAFGHHWIGKAVITRVAFIIAGFLWKGGRERIAWYSALGSLIVIFLFYVAEFFT